MKEWGTLVTKNESYLGSVFESGNSLVVTIPKTIKRKLKINAGDLIRITIERW